MRHPARPLGQSKKTCDGTVLCALQRLHQRQQHEVQEDQVEQHLEAHVEGEIANRVDGHLGIVHGTRAKPGRGSKCFLLVYLE